MWFRIAWGIDLVAVIVLLWFFVTGLARGSVSSFNLGLWVTLLAIAVGVLATSGALRLAKHEVLASLLASVLAVPCILYGLFVLVIVVFPGRWN